jgi:hypothetical protein
MGIVAAIVDMLLLVLVVLCVVVAAAELALEEDLETNSWTRLLFFDDVAAHIFRVPCNITLRRLRNRRNSEDAPLVRSSCSLICGEDLSMWKRA